MLPSREDFDPALEGIRGAQDEKGSEGTFLLFLQELLDQRLLEVGMKGT